MQICLKTIAFNTPAETNEEVKWPSFYLRVCFRFKMKEPQGKQSLKTATLIASLKYNQLYYPTEKDMSSYVAKSKGKPNVTPEKTRMCVAGTANRLYMGEITAHCKTSISHRTAELLSQKYLLNELSCCLVQLFFLFLFLSFSRDHLEKGNSCLVIKTKCIS